MQRMKFNLVAAVLAVLLLLPAACGTEIPDDEPVDDLNAKRLEREARERKAKKAYAEVKKEAERCIEKEGNLEKAIAAYETYPAEFRSMKYWVNDIEPQIGTLKRKLKMNEEWPNVRAKVENLYNKGEYKKALWELNMFTATYNGLYGTYFNAIDGLERKIKNRLNSSDR